MLFRLADVDTDDDDFGELIACLWESFDRPYQPFYRLYCPMLGTGPTARAEALQESTQHFRDWHRDDPASYWQKVTDVDTGKIVAGALWKIYKSNPFEKPEDYEPYWYPEGSRRDFVRQAIKQFSFPRSQFAQRPQICTSVLDFFFISLSPLDVSCESSWKFQTVNAKVDLNILFVHPDFRRKGIGEMMLESGINQADELGVEMWLDATACGVPLYKQHGFQVASENKLCPQTERPDDEWKKIEQELMPLSMWPMWRPRGGKYMDGITVRPWEQ